MPDFLLEIGCEEIPARMLAEAMGHLHQSVAGLLEASRLLPEIYDETKCFDLSTPRRLAIVFPEILAKQKDAKETMIGPPVNVAYKDGMPTKAAEGFAKKVGVPLDALERKEVGKAEYLQATVMRRGKHAAAILTEFLPREIAGIPWPKNMYWRKTNERFVRPVRWLVAMLDGETIPLEFDGIWAGNISRGHRILSQESVTIGRAGSTYVEALRAAKVLGREEREQQIRKALDAATRTISGARWREDKPLLDTVVNLTEFPSVILGGFDPQFLALPEEVLVTVMRDHQKYFAVEDSGGKLLPYFLAVLNTDGDPRGLIRHGNERVLRARFNDARFFWEMDQKRSLLERLDLLKHVTFQKDLGSYYEKTQRVQRLCSWLSEIIKQNGMAVRAGVIHKAACLAKTDLTTELVKEFTELQGIVGGLYARVQELDATLPEATRLAIADAIYDHYKPESTEDDVPRSMEGAVLSIGDKADTIAGMFALGLVPTGSKDPFALRRQANGIVKVIAEKNLPLRLADLMRDARAGYKGSEAENKFVDDTKFSESMRIFFRERLEFYLKDVRGYAYDVVKAVLAAGDEDFVQAERRVQAVSEMRASEDFRSVCVAFKRINNILRQAFSGGIREIWSPKAELYSEAEKSLFNNMRPVMVKFSRLASKGSYGEALLELSKLRPYIDDFFNNVMVMADDEDLRKNRLALLETLKNGFSQIADFSEIVTEGKA